MPNMMNVYRQFARIAPKRYKIWLERKLVCCGISFPADVFFGFTFLFGLILSLILSIVLLLVMSFYFLFFFVYFGIILASVFVAINAILILVADRKAAFVDEILPDALQLMAANIRAGITPDRALFLAARPEFGPLEIEIKRAAKETLTGKPMEDSLLEIPKRIESRTLLRTMRLIAEGLRSGGELATLLDETASDVRQSQSIRKEIKANVAMYGIFIFFATAFGAPMLYAISSYLVEMIMRISSTVAMPEVSVGFSPIRLSSPGITADFLFNFSLVAIVITTAFGGLIVGLIEAGKEKAGIRYVFMLMAMGIIVFFAIKAFLIMMFGGFGV